MGATATLRAKLTLNNAEFMRGMSQAMTTAKRFAGGLPTAALNVFKAGLVGGAAGATALAAGLALCIQKAGQMQKLEASFDVLLGGQAQAKAMLKSMNQLAARTPLKTEDIARAGKSLLAFGEDQSTVIDTIRRMGDIAAGVDAPINDIATIYGKARVQGRLFAEDINQLTGRGIPVITELAKVFGVTDSEVKQLVTDGKVGFAQLEKAFVNMTNEGGKFYGMMEKQSKTWEGQLSTLSDNIDMAMAAFGRPWIDKLTPYLTNLNLEAGKLESFAKNFGEGLTADLASAIEGQSISQAFLNVSGMFYAGMTAAAKGIGQALLASLLNAVQAPIAALQAAHQSFVNKAFNLSQGNVGLSKAEEDALEGHRQGLASDMRAAEKLTPAERNGEMGAMIARSILDHQKRINAAETKRGLETDPGKLFNTIMASGGPKIGFGKGMNAGQIMAAAEKDFKSSMAGIFPQTAAAIAAPLPTTVEQSPIASVPIPKFDKSELQSLAQKQGTFMKQGISGAWIPGAGSDSTASGDFSSINAQGMETSGSMASTFGKPLFKSQNFSVFKPGALGWNPGMGSTRGLGNKGSLGSGRLLYGKRDVVEMGKDGKVTYNESVRETTLRHRIARQARLDQRYGRTKDGVEQSNQHLQRIEKAITSIAGEGS